MKLNKFIYMNYGKYLKIIISIVKAIDIISFKYFYIYLKENLDLCG